MMPRLRAFGAVVGLVIVGFGAVSLAPATAEPIDGGAPPGQPVPPRFTDVPAHHWAFTAIHWAEDEGIVSGYPDASFRPDRFVTRAQAPMWLWRQEGTPTGANLVLFDDIGGTSWAFRGIGWAGAEGIVTGYGDGTFRPQLPVSRAQFVMMLWRQAGEPAPAGPSPFGDSSPWAARGIAWAAEQGLVSGYPDGTFRPDRAVTRAQGANIMWARFATP